MVQNFCAILSVLLTRFEGHFSIFVSIFVNLVKNAIFLYRKKLISKLKYIVKLLVFNSSSQGVSLYNLTTATPFSIYIFYIYTYVLYVTF